MDRETLDSLDKEALIRLILSQAEAIERLTREIEALRADNAALRAKLDLPPKTPENSSTPPSQGHKAAGEECKTQLVEVAGLSLLAQEFAPAAQCAAHRERGVGAMKKEAPTREPYCRFRFMLWRCNIGDTRAKP